MKKISLKFKFFIWTLILGLFFMFALVLIVDYRLNDLMVNDKLNQLNNNVSAHVLDVSNQFNYYKLMSYMLGTRTRVMEYILDQTEDRRSELDGIFREYHMADKNILSIYLMDREGNALISSDPVLVGNNYSFRDYFQSAVKGVPYMDALIGKTTNQFGFYFSYPVYDANKNIIGVLAIKISDEYINNAIKNSNIADNGNVVLLDRQGIILFSSNPSFVLHSAWPLGEEEKSDLVNSQRFSGVDIQPLFYTELEPWFKNYTTPGSVQMKRYSDNHEIVVYVTQIGESSFYFAASVDLTIIKTQIFYKLLWSLLLGLVIVALVAVIVYLLALKMFVNPLKLLIDFSQKVSKGNFQEKINFYSNDELNELALSMNVMSEKLANYYSDLFNEVKDKTKELEEKSGDLSDQQKAILNILEDVEEEKNKVQNLVEDLEKFKLAVENASDHILIANNEGIIIYANKAVEKITGFTQKEIIGQKAGILSNWGGKMDKDFYAKLWKTVKKDKKTFSGEIYNHRKNGEEYIAYASISPIKNKNGEVIFFVALERDITKEKEVDKSKTEFVSLASHQLRTPLTSLRLFGELLAKDKKIKLNNIQKEYLENINLSTLRMIRLVNDLLNVSRLESGRLAVNPEPTDLVKLINDVLIETTGIANEHNIGVSFIKSTKVLPKIKLDPSLMNEVLVSTVSNAIRYSLPKTKDVEIKIEKIKQEYVISVRDYGIGIPKESQSKIFEKFFRADNAVSHEADGSGLGLYIAKKIMDTSGGRIWFESDIGKGTTFYFAIPLTGMKQREGEKGIAK